MTPTPAQLENIAALCERRWDFFYTRSKLASDPVYQAVVREIGQSPLPVLDIGCGIGLLAHYLRACGHSAPVTGFDYDKRKIASAQAMVVKSGQQGLSFSSGDARTGLPDFMGHVVILDILQFFTQDEQNQLLATAAARVAPGGKLVIRTCLRDDSRRFKITVAGDYLAKMTFWMKDAPICYPDAQQFRDTLSAEGLNVEITPLWGGTPFNNHLIVAQR